MEPAERARDSETVVTAPIWRIALTLGRPGSERGNFSGLLFSMESAILSIFEHRNFGENASRYHQRDRGELVI